LLHWHVPVAPGVLVEQTSPDGHPQVIVPPVPLSRLVPHLPPYPVEHVSGVLQAPVPSLEVHTWSVHQHTREPAQLQVRADPQPGVTGCFVSLHSAPSPPLPAHAGAGVQHALFMHTAGAHLLQVYVVPAGLHESWMVPHDPASRLQVSVRVQHVPTTPFAGAGPGLPVEFATHSSVPEHVTVIVCPHPSGRLVPHWFWPL
jgi:hypothetical protein